MHNIFKKLFIDTKNGIESPYFVQLFNNIIIYNRLNNLKFQILILLHDSG